MGDESKSTYEVFISYSSKDKKWADATCAVLEKRRVRCWIAPRDITPGTEWGAAIIGGIDASKIMLVIFSAQANQSAQVRREVERALGKGLIILPFRIEDVSPAGAMEYALSNTHWLDGFTPPLERHFDLLASSVKALLAKDSGEAPEPPAPPAIAPAPPRPHDRLLIAVGSAVLTLIIVAGLFALFRSGTVPQTAETVGQSDQERIQGRWRVEAVDRITKTGNRASGDTTNPVWIFRGTDLTVLHTVDGSEAVSLRGSFSLRSDGKRKLFDFDGMIPNGRPLEFRGIYQLEGEFLKVCYWVVRLRDDPTKQAQRPDSFDLDGEHMGSSLKLRHIVRGSKKGR